MPLVPFKRQCHGQPHHHPGLFAAMSTAKFVARPGRMASVRSDASNGRAGDAVVGGGETGRRAGRRGDGDQEGKP